MQIITKSFTIVLIILAFVSCKDDNKQMTVENGSLPIKNEVTAIKGAPVVDISNNFKFKTGQFIPDENSVYILKSLNVFNIYTQGTANAADLDFSKNDVIALFCAKSNTEVNFKVEKFDNGEEYTRLEVSSDTTQNRVTAYRPSLLLKIPKSELKESLLLKLNGVSIPIISME